MILIKITKEDREPKVGEWCDEGFPIDQSDAEGPAAMDLSELKTLSLSVIRDAPENASANEILDYVNGAGKYPISNSEEIFQWLSDNGKLGEEWVEWEGSFVQRSYKHEIKDITLCFKREEPKTCTCPNPLIRGVNPEYCGVCEKDLESKKEKFINQVSKINETGEDEFKAEFNSPELIWEKIIKHLK